MHFLHLVGSYALTIGLLSQTIVLGASLKSGEKPAAIQSAILMGALGSLTVSLLLRAPTPPALLPDIIAVLGGLLLLTPGVQALLKLRQKKAG